MQARQKDQNTPAAAPHMFRYILFRFVKPPHRLPLAASMFSPLSMECLITVYHTKQRIATRRRSFFAPPPRSRRRMTFPAGKANDTEWCEPVANGEYAKLN